MPRRDPPVKIPMGMCQIVDCTHRAQYLMWVDDRQKRLVCLKHDRMVGIANLQAAFRLTLGEAITMNARMSRNGIEKEKNHD